MCDDERDECPHGRLLAEECRECRDDHRAADPDDDEPCDEVPL